MSFRLILLFTALGACAGSDPTTTTTTTTTAASTPAREHAPPSAVPGSHEDWCVEHALPESQCTRCNPSLAAAFKATNDWCEEHGLPESHCRKCNPDLTIERPPAQH